jgi:murein DD-endopeptidase MepM/ murein hydrolase activator NlpD
VIASPGIVVALGGAVLAATVAFGVPAGQVVPPVDPTPGAVTYVGPLPAPLGVLRGFDPPATEFGPGHLGVDLRAGPGASVGAAAAGLVQFAGQVAGRGVVVISHPDGIRTEYEPVRPAVHAGDHVRSGAVIGTLLGRHAGCPVSCLHWGARRGTAYLDPLTLLRPLGPVVLLPDGTNRQARGWAR